MLDTIKKKKNCFCIVELKINYRKQYNQEPKKYGDLHEAKLDKFAKILNYVCNSHWIYDFGFE